MYGLNHSILPNELDKIAVLANLDSQVRKTCKNNNIILKFDSKNNLRHSAKTFVKKQNMFTIQNQIYVLSQKSWKANALMHYKETALCKKDKGMGTVILNREEYFLKAKYYCWWLLKIQSFNYNIYQHKVKVWHSAPWITQDKVLSTTAINISKQLVSEAEHHIIYLTWSQQGKLYGMAKDHKLYNTIRPINH